MKITTLAAALAIAATPLTVFAAGTAHADPACVRAALAAGPDWPAYYRCFGVAGPMQFPQCDQYNGDLMSHQICVDNVARGLPPDNIRRP